MNPGASPYSPKQRLVAVLAGALCHASFAAAIAVMMLSIGSGFALALGHLPRPLSGIVNLLLLAQFPLLHSWLLAESGRRRLARLVPYGLGHDLATTTYATLASWQLLLTFLAWTPSRLVWWQASGHIVVPCVGLYLAAWLLLLKTMVDAGLGVQTGWLGWSAVARGRTPTYGAFRPRGTFRVVRQPIYVAFALTLWTTPTWTPDGLLLALGWTVYCLVGPLWKERRYARHFGDAWRAYQRAVPYWLPRRRRWHVERH